VATPSQADELITTRLKEALALIDVRLIDHLIVGSTIYSFAEAGLL
jgi:DNA repair protein RadC